MARRQGRPFTIRSRRPDDTEVVVGPPAWQRLRDAAVAFQAQGHTASTATLAEHVLRPRRR